MSRGGVGGLAILVLLASLWGCSEEREPDARFATPESTLDTLLGVYGVADMSQEEIQQQMRSRGRFELRDEATYEACFDDYDGPQHEGLAGYVFGTVAAGKDQLRINMVQGKAHVFPDPDRRERYVVLVQSDGEWKISLRESVPADVRGALIEQYERMSERRGGQ